MSMREWFSGDGNIVLNIPDEVVAECTASGNSKEAIKRGVAHKDMQQQLHNLDMEKVAEYLNRYLADVNQAELMDRELNLERLLQIACWDIVDRTDPDDD